MSGKVQDDKQILRDHALSQMNVYKFKKGSESVEGEDRSRRPSTSIIEQHVQNIEELVLINRRMTARDAVGISKRFVNTILKDILGPKRAKSRLVPKQLSFFEKECRIEICKTMLSHYQPVMEWNWR